MDSSTWRILKLTHRGQHRTGERSLISTIALLGANVMQCRDSDDANVTEMRIAIEASSSAAR